MTAKYELDTTDTITVANFTLYRLRALRDIPGRVAKGGLGGYIQAPVNLSQDGNCWIGRDAIAFDGAQVRDNAFLSDGSQASAGAVVKDNARMEHSAQVIGNIVVGNNEHLYSQTMLLNATVLRSSHFVHEGNTIFTFAYQARNTLGAVAIPASDCDFRSAIELSLRVNGGNLALYTKAKQAKVFSLAFPDNPLAYADIFKQLTS